MDTDTGTSLTGPSLSPGTPEPKGIASLPEEILCLIASYLDDRDITSCELVSSSWNASFGRPLVVRDCIARGFRGLLHRVDVLSDGEMRSLYRAKRNSLGFRRRGQFVSCIAEYPLRKGETHFTSDPMPPPKTACLLVRNEETGRTMARQCLPSSWTNRYHRGCVAWRLSDKFTVIDNLETMAREIIEWPGYEGLMKWEEENPNPNRVISVDIKAFTEDLLVLQDSRQLGEIPVQHMMVYHRHLKQWHTVELPGTQLSYTTRFYASGTDVVYRATLKAGELPPMDNPRCGTGLRAMLSRRHPFCETLHRWSWTNDKETGFRPLEGAELPPDVTSTEAAQLGAIFHPADPSTMYVVTVTLSRTERDEDDGEHGFNMGLNTVHATAVKYRNGIPVNTVTPIEYGPTLLLDTTGYSATVRDDVKFPYSPSSTQGDHILAMVQHKVLMSRYRHRVSTVLFNPLTERFSHASTPDMTTTWPGSSFERDFGNRGTSSFLWSGLLHHHLVVDQDLVHRYPKLYKQPMDAFVRFATMQGDTSQSRRYLPIPEPGKWRIDDQLATRIVGDERYLVLMHAEGYVVWCFEERRGAPAGGWRSWEESRPLVDETRKNTEDFLKVQNLKCERQEEEERARLADSDDGGVSVSGSRFFRR